MGAQVRASQSQARPMRSLQGCVGQWQRAQADRSVAARAFAAAAVAAQHLLLQQFELHLRELRCLRSRKLEVHE